MAKSFCTGCKHWRIADKEYYDNHRFHFCERLLADELKRRKELCNGKLKEL